MGAVDDLKSIDESTDWPALIELALGVPPKPMQLLDRLQQWATVFGVVYGGRPLEPDYPEAVRAFFRRIAFADISPELHEWADLFEERHGRRPRRNEVPARLRKLLPSDDRRGGRPRLDTKRWRDARAAWTAEIFRESYEMRRDGIRIGREAGFSSCFGFSPEDMDGDSPSSLALERLAGETGLSPSRLADLIGHRRKKK